MSNQDDRGNDDAEWLDALAGRATHPEGSELRKAVLARVVSEGPEQAATDSAREDELITRARLNGLMINASALEGDPFARRMSWISALRASSRGWVAAAIAVGVLVVGWQFRVPVSNEVTRTAPGGITRLVNANPPALKQQIVDEFRAAGVEAIGYERLGSSGVDAELPQPVSPAVRAVLEKHGIPVPTDGVVRVEIAAPEAR